MAFGIHSTYCYTFKKMVKESISWRSPNILVDMDFVWTVRHMYFNIFYCKPIKNSYMPHLLPLHPSSATWDPYLSTLKRRIPIVSPGPCTLKRMYPPHDPGCNRHHQNRQSAQPKPTHFPLKMLPASRLQIFSIFFLQDPPYVCI